MIAKRFVPAENQRGRTSVEKTPDKKTQSAEKSQGGSPVLLYFCEHEQTFDFVRESNPRTPASHTLPQGPEICFNP